MADIRDKDNKTTVPTQRKKTIMPEGMYEDEIKMNNDLLKLLGVRISKPLILTITSIYKDQESSFRGDYRGREFYNNKNRLIAKYKENKDEFNGIVRGI